MSVIQCIGRIINIAEWHVLRLPAEASELLSSRGMAMIEGTLNGLPITVAVEPDGKGGHWFRLSEALLKEGGLDSGDEVELAFSQLIEWREPDIPRDIEDALKSAHLYEDVWRHITPKAKWEWLRWIRSTKNEATRKKRIEVAVDKLNKGLKRPCCFNSALCTEQQVCRNGVLLG